MDGYEVKLYLDPDEGRYVAQIVEFVGCAVDGATPEEALANLCEAKHAWIEAVRSAGHSIPPPRYAVVQRVPVA